MVALNLRGNSGAGKTHLARRLIELYPNRIINMLKPGSKRPMSYICTGRDHPLFVLGDYEAAWGGGADAVTSREEGFKQLMAAAGQECHMLWEGVVYSDEVPRTLLLARLQPLHIIFLTTPLEQCLADIRARREAKGNMKPLSETITRSRHKSLANIYDRLRLSQTPNLHVHRLDREQAFLQCKELLGL